ncbi:hypothetical protein ACPV4I_19590 [Photobacterium damselae]
MDREGLKNRVEYWFLVVLGSVVATISFVMSLLAVFMIIFNISVLMICVVLIPLFIGMVATFFILKKGELLDDSFAARLNELELAKKDQDLKKMANKG